MLKKPLPKKIIFEETLYLYTDIHTVFGCSLQEAAKNILALEDRLKAEHKKVIDNPNLYEKFHIDISTSDNYPEIRLSGIREETDEAYKVRVEKYEKAEAAKAEGVKKRKDTRAKNLKARELAELDRLTKKYKDETNE